MTTWPPLHLVGLTHRNAALGLRERLSLSRVETLALLNERCESRSPAVIVSTCNRFEIYWWGDAPWEEWLTELATRRGIELPAEAIIRRSGLAAARHLFAVAAGLESQIVGETEVLGQVRRAWEVSREAECTSRELDLVFAGALGAGRRVRRHSFAGRHPASVGSVAVDIARAERGGSLDDSRIVVLGSGQAARTVIAALLDREGLGFTVVSRHPDRAASLAVAGRVEIVPWDGLPNALTTADLVFAATGASRPVVSREQLVRALGASRPMTVLDLGVPRNVDPTARDLPGVTLLDLDDLRRRGCPAGAPRSNALRDAEDLLADETERLARRLRALSASARLARLHRIGEELARVEAERAIEELGLTTESEREIVRQSSRRLIRKILYRASQAIQDQEPSAAQGETLGETTA